MEAMWAADLQAVARQREGQGKGDGNSSKGGGKTAEGQGKAVGRQRKAKERQWPVSPKRAAHHSGQTPLVSAAESSAAGPVGLARAPSGESAA